MDWRHLGRNRSGRRAMTLAFWLPGTAFAKNTVPLAWRNMLVDRRRLLRSTCGIGFAVLLMLLQLGFRTAFLDSALQVIRNIDGDIFLVSSTKFRFGRKDPFPRRLLYASNAVDGVKSVHPIYGEWLTSSWKNPQTLKTYTIQVLAFDPDRPVFLFPEVQLHLAELRQPDTALFDRRGREFVGEVPAGTISELSRRQIQTIGTFELGPDFTTDATLITSDRTFMKFFASNLTSGGELADVEFGVIKIRDGYSVANVQQALKTLLPPSIAVLTKSELLALETKFQNDVSPVGPIFMLGTIIGFIVGMLISYQILYTDLSDQMPQYATLKAIGYTSSYLVFVVLQQALFYAVVGFLPALLLGLGLYRIIGELVLLPLRISIATAVLTFALTVGMCVLAGLLSVKRVIAADPAEVF